MNTHQDGVAGARPLIVALNGSERPDGNTARVLEHARAVAESVGAVLDVIHLREYRVADCASCGDCNTRATTCAVPDDMPEIIARMRQADGIVYACPVHGYGMASTMQRFIERAGVGYLRFERPLTNKVAGVIVTGRRYGHTDVHAQLLHNALLNRMILVGSGYPAVVHGGAPGRALEDSEGLDSITSMIRRMVDMLTLLAEHRSLTGGDLRQLLCNERGTPARTPAAL